MEDELTFKAVMNKMQDESKIVDVVLQSLVDYCASVRSANISADADPSTTYLSREHSTH